MNVQEIVGFQKELLNKLLDYKEQNQDFTFLLRKNATARVKAGYCFHGSEEYLALGFFNELDTKSRVPTINLSYNYKSDATFFQVSYREKTEILEKFYSEVVSHLEKNVKRFKIKEVKKQNDEKTVYFIFEVNFDEALKISLDSIIPDIKELIEKHALGSSLLVTEEDLTRDMKKLEDCWSNQLKNEQALAKGTEGTEKALQKGINQILYGPPGTGKTYNTVIKAVEICDPDFKGDYDAVKDRYKELKEDGRIEFVTFHQSYGYEEFIEGIRAETDPNSGSISYSVVDGIFKRLCDKSKAQTKTSQLEQAIQKLKVDCEEDIELATSRGNKFYLTYRGGRTFRIHPLDTKKEIADYPASIENIIKLYNGDNEIYNYSYVKGILEFLKSNYGVPEEPEKLDNAPYVIIIDEINRGNMSKIFGELITLIEDDKRLGKPNEMTVRLPVSGDEFGVPSNLHIIGTMNTADRSIAMMDTALRRRFEFVEMMPDAEVFDDFGNNGIINVQLKDGASFDLNLKDMLNKINQRIEVLYDREHTIGHAYFMSLKESATIDKLSSIFKNKVIPLLAEYFFEDWEKIRMVLGDNQKENSKRQFVIEKESVKYNDLFGPKVDLGSDDERKVYERNPEALKHAESYFGIYSEVS
ncbi:McrB family protein [Ghiorsea bivora]|uniref:McrB family protein n=1 Tax=Ghiorsea bivora TaxID=1485545 RepID=UPI0006912892|nr:AAA family ATPase [Ghiorsea bivora]